MTSGETYYRLEATTGCSIITLLPELNDKQWADIEKVGTELVERIGTSDSPRIVVDLVPLNYMGSAMVALIVRLYKTVNGRGGRMAVVNQHELVHEVLKLAGLTKLWTIVGNREEAFSALGVKSRGGVTSETSQPGGNGVLVAGIIGAVGAIAGLALQLSPSTPVPQKAALLIELGFAAVGLIVGTMILVNQTGMRRNIGIALLAICLLVVLGGIMISGPEPKKGEPAPPRTNGRTSAVQPSGFAQPFRVAAPLTAGDRPAFGAVRHGRIRERVLV